MTTGRDAEADLRLCEAATKGPWVPYQSCDEDGWWWVWQESKLPYYGGVLDLPAARHEPGAVGHACVNDTIPGTEQERRDAEFISMARESLPFWIAEAVKLRFEVASHREALAHARSLADSLAARVAGQAELLGRNAERREM